MEAQISEEQRASTDPGDVQACLHAGVLPKCYEGTNIGVEVQELGEVSCFIRHEDGRVTCPIGRELYYHSEKAHGKIYGSQEACRTCPNRCTSGKGEKRVQFGPNTIYVPVKMYGSGKYPLQAIPNVSQDTPNHSLNRKGRAETKVVLTIRRDLGKQQIRKETVEHPFGTLKWYDGYHYFLCKGKEKVAAETALAFLSYNLRRAIRLTAGPNGGVPGILVYLRARNRTGWVC